MWLGCVVKSVGGNVVCEGVRYKVRFDFFFQAEDGIRDLVRSRGLGDVYKRQVVDGVHAAVRQRKAQAGQKSVPQADRAVQPSD